MAGMPKAKGIVMTPHIRERSADTGAGSGKAMDRVVAFSDGVFAFAITLLVVSLDVPELPAGAAARELAGALLAQAPRFGSYAFSFWVVAIFWMAHHRMYEYIVRYDGRLLQMNLLMLLGIAFLPYPVELLGRYGDQPVAVAFYCGTMAFVGFTSTGLWTYAIRRGLLRPDTPKAVIRHFGARAVTAPLVFLASAVVALFNVGAAYFAFILIPVIQGYLRRRYAGAGIR